MMLEGFVDGESVGCVVTRFQNRRAAITWLLRKLERDHPGRHEYEAKIVEGDR